MGLVSDDEVGAGGSAGLVFDDRCQITFGEPACRGSDTQSGIDGVGADEGGEFDCGAVLASIGSYTRAGFLQDKEMRLTAEKWTKALSTKTPSVRQRIRNLSGGNQQKVVLAKWLERDCDILISDEPTRGIDVGAKQEIYDLLNELTDQGKSIIMISSAMEETLRMSDRIAVMCNGQITGFLSNEEATQEKIMELATHFHETENTSEADQ